MSRLLVWSFRVLCISVLVTLAACSTIAYLGQLPIWLPGIPLHDKAAHFVLYGLAALFLDGGLHHRNVLVRGRSLPLAGVIAGSVGVIEELAQALSPRRTCTFWDLFANVLGVVCLVALGRLLFMRRVAPGA